MKFIRSIVLILVFLALQTPAHGQRRGGITPGSTAPGLDVENWDNDESTNIESGNVYLVCFTQPTDGDKNNAALNRFNDALDHYESSELKVIVISIGDAAGALGFTGALTSHEHLYWGFDRRNSSERAWVQAANQNSFPVVFLVDRKSKIQYIGEPSGEKFTSVLNKVMNDRYDVTLMMQAERYLKPAENARKVRNFRQCHMHLDSVIELDKRVFADAMLKKFELILLDEKKKDEAYDYAQSLIAEVADDPEFLSWLTEFILTDPRISASDRDLDVAMDAAETAFNGFDKSRSDPFALMAKVHYHHGNLEQAVEYQEKAWLVARPNRKPDQWRILITYKEAARRQGILSSAQ